MVRVKRLMAILMSVMMLVTLLPSNSVVVNAAPTKEECNHILTAEDIARLPEDFWKTHSHEEYAVGSPAFIGVEVPAGCEKDGWHIAKSDTTGFCMICGEIITEGDKVTDKAIGHNFDKDNEEADNVVAPTCEKPGYRTCINSNYTLDVKQVNGLYAASLVEEKCTEKEEIPALGHDYVIDESLHVDPTCTEKGSDTYVCQNDPNHTKVEEIPALGHDYQLDESKHVDPTCTEKGSDTYVCQNDPSHIQVEEIDAIGHDYEETIVQEATCYNPGTKLFTCKNCGDSYTEVIPQLEHTGLKVTLEPTCTDSGKKEGVCELCGRYVIEAIPALGHDLKAEVKEPTCTEDGYTTYTCQREGCDFSYVGDYKVKLGHDYVADESLTETKKATCEEAGTITHYEVCSRCGDKKVSSVEEIPALGHDYQLDESLHVDPTCTEKGSDTYVCQNDSSHRYDVEIPATGHSYVVTETVDPTCTESGRNVYTCENCGDAFVEYIPALGHDIENIETIEPNCVHGTITEGICKRCGKVIVEEDDDIDYSVSFAGGLGFAGANGFYVEPVSGEKDTYYLKSYLPTADILVNFAAVLANPDLFMEFITSTGHDFYNYSANAPYAAEYVPATCETDGYWTITCSREEEVPVAGTYDSVDDIVTETRTCPYPDADASQGHVLKIVNANSAYGHLWQLLDDDSSKAPTCTEEGYRHYMCLNDHAHTYTETIPALGHEYKITDTVAATCTTEGYDVYTCERCGDSYNKTTTPALGHNYAITDTVAATCITEGYDVYTCKNCGDSYNKTTTPALGHSYKITESVASTCAKEGYNVYTCTRCDDTYTEIIAKIPHKGVVTGTVSATCTEEGYDIYICKECGETWNVTTTPAKGHHFVETNYVAPTCTEQGVRTYKCTDCDETYNTYEKALGHNYGKITVVPATCTEEGYTVHSCTNPGCTDSYVTDKTAKVPHVLSVVDQKAPTCAEDGYETRACANCDYTETKVIPATGNHVYDNAVTKEATCTEDGVMTYTCKVCGTTYTEVIPAIGHNFGKSEVVEATCTENGYTVYTCTNPGCVAKDENGNPILDENGNPLPVSYITDETDKADHVLSVIEQKDATCTENGYVVKGCANCDYTEKEVIPATDHIFDTEGVNTPATCEKEGYTTYTCAVCGKKQVVKTAEKLGHVYKSEVSATATLGKDGIQTEVCIHCGKKIVSNTITAIKSVTLAQTKFAYTGKKILPAVIVKDAKGNTVSSKYYTVTYANNKKIGTATATVTFKGLYTGTLKLKYTIVPKGVGISKTSSTKRTIKYTWGRVKNADGYKIQYSTSKNFKKAKKVTIKNRKTCVTYLKNLKSGKKYYVRVRAYKKVSGKTYYGDWSSSSRICK